MEKVTQFSAMTSSQSMYCVTYDSNNVNTTEGSFFKRKVCITNRVTKIGKEESNDWVEYDESKIKMHVRGDENETRFDTLSISC